MASGSNKYTVSNKLSKFITSQGDLRSPFDKSTVTPRSPPLTNDSFSAEPAKKDCRPKSVSSDSELDSDMEKGTGAEKRQRCF